MEDRGRSFTDDNKKIRTIFSVCVVLSSVVCLFSF